MQVEMYIGFPDHTWRIEIVDVPDDTPINLINQTAQNRLDEMMEKNDIECAFSRIYKIWPPEEEEEEEKQDAFEKELEISEEERTVEL